MTIFQNEKAVLRHEGVLKTYEMLTYKVEKTVFEATPAQARTIAKEALCQKNVIAVEAIEK